MTSEKDSDWSPYASVYDPLKVGSIDGTDTRPHDRAVWRAMHASYEPNPDVEGNPRNTVFVARLHPKVTDADLLKLFSHYGEVKCCRVVRDVVTGMSKNYGFVEYSTLKEAQKAHRDAHRARIHDKEIIVEYEFGRTLPGWIPRRLGGGFGGKKESGQLRFGCRAKPFARPIVLEKNRTCGSTKDERPRARTSWEKSVVE